MNIKGDYQTGFFKAEVIPSPPHPTSPVCSHKKEDETTVSSLTPNLVLCCCLILFPSYYWS